MFFEIIKKKKKKKRIVLLFENEEVKEMRKSEFVDSNFFLMLLCELEEVVIINIIGDVVNEVFVSDN